MANAGPTEERVKPCLECGTILPFDAELCSLCGVSARAAKAADEPEPIKPCLACGALIGESALFCPDCGDFTLSVETPSLADLPRVGETGRGVAALSKLVSGMILVAGLTLLVVVAVDYVRLRGFDLAS